ncbi:Inherit from COG: Phosphoglycerate mutase [Seminavis robusta]|uniref:Inherit from COG: Phosphoglycerate mutase n=1 Tax=Seminavis robusta TaxID=568900 RepID=A0A9N8EGS9_9STRA|nr:Inherit from COG: Phosphoglycerate mutase [Seminavis robusta]|eukprot:Sro1168_g248550.1 Inherit from COG: Phosphoglycerate mutase (378) ;mRNA; r:30548-31814
MRLLLTVLLLLHWRISSGFVPVSSSPKPTKKAASVWDTRLLATSHDTTTNNKNEDDDTDTSSLRRSLLLGIGSSSVAMMTLGTTQDAALAAVGTLPEFQESNAILQGLTIDVVDQSQLKTMIDFLNQAFGFDVLRQRIRGSIEEVWLGFGPEELAIPADFTLPVSSFGKYGGHASLCIRYDAKSTAALYRIGDSNPPGSNIAFLQVGVPSYRISQMSNNGGNILDAYGFVNVISPSGLPIRGIVGIRPDPIMFVAINCDNVKQSQAFYEQTLGFSQQVYPFARPSNGTGPFEPAQPKGSVYLAPSPYSMGVLLLPSKKKVTPNPVMDSLKVVYTPSSASSDNDSSDGGGAMQVVDPSNVKISFQSASDFEQEERVTR